MAGRLLGKGHLGLGFYITGICVIIYVTGIIYVCVYNGY